MTRFSKIVSLALAGTLSLAASSGARAEDKPSEIRIAYPGVGVGNRPFVGGNTTAVVHLKGMLEEEFRQDGIKVNWSFLRGAGPAVNELYANKLYWKPAEEQGHISAAPSAPDSRSATLGSAIH